MKVQFTFDNGKIDIIEVNATDKMEVLRVISQKTGWYVIQEEELAINLDLVTKISFPKPSKTVVRKF